MSGGLNRVLATLFVAGVAFLAAPSVVLACGGGPSAKNVYTPCVPTGGGGKSPSGSSTSHTHSGAGKTPSSTPVPTSGPTAVALKHAGKDRRVLATLVQGYGVKRLLRSPTPVGAAGAPTALGSAFDVGSGPIGLLIVLAATALLLLAGSGMRVWRTRKRT